MRQNIKNEVANLSEVYNINAELIEFKYGKAKSKIDMNDLYNDVINGIGKPRVYALIEKGLNNPLEEVKSFLNLYSNDNHILLKVELKQVTKGSYIEQSKEVREMLRNVVLLKKEIESEERDKKIILYIENLDLLMSPIQGRNRDGMIIDLIRIFLREITVDGSVFTNASEEMLRILSENEKLQSQIRLVSMK